MTERIEFIKDAGACLTTRNVIEGRAPIRWLDRGESENPVDNGWRIFSSADTTDYLQDQSNWVVADFNDLCLIEPALVGIWDFEVGTELELVQDEHGKRFVDSRTGQVVPNENLYVPPAFRSGDGDPGASAT